MDAPCRNIRVRPVASTRGSAIDDAAIPEVDDAISSLRKQLAVCHYQCGPAFRRPAFQVVEHAFDYLDHQPLRVNSDDVPTPYAKTLEAEYLPHKGKIIRAVKASLNRL